MQKAFLFDINKCTGCEACQVACTIENNVPLDVSWREVYAFNPTHVPNLPSFHLSLACNHCIDPPCMRHCPADAYRKDSDTGAVTIDPDKCIGCHYCSWACPFDAPRFNIRTGVMEKCTFCAHRLEQGQPPACVTSCPTGALQIVDYASAGGSTESPGFPDVGVRAATRFVPLRGMDEWWNTADRRRPAGKITGTGKVASKVTLRGEWPLVLFTLLVPLLTGWMSAPPETSWPPMVAGIAAMLLSGLHLGKPLRAHRAVLNWRRSWLSREILLFVGFLACSAIVLFSGLPPLATSFGHWIAVPIGAGALLAIDNVYSVTRTPWLRLHSAGALLSGALFIGWFVPSEPLFYGAIAVKLALYLWRKYRLARQHQAVRPAASALRITVGLLVPLLLHSTWSEAGSIVIACLILGELIDRVEFYLELEVPSPRTQMHYDLASAANAT